MDKDYIAKRKESLQVEFKKGAEALNKMQEEANKIAETMKQIKGAILELTNQEEILNGSTKEDAKSKKDSKKTDSK